jgi:3-oxocholest-4-en-26-oyl-CoA dehydrogenase beta subunit
MEFHDSETQRLLRRTARAFFTDAYPFERLDALHKGHQRLSPSDVASLAELGWLSLLAPEDAGGGGGSLLDAAVLVEEAGYACAPAPIALANIAARLVSTSTLDLPASTLTTISSTKGAPIRISNRAASGSLGSVAFADVSDWVVTPTSLEGQTALVALPLRDADIEPLILLDRSCYANVTFNDAGVGDMAVLASGDAASEASSTCDALTTAFATIETAGLMKRVLEMTSEHIKTRQQFGQPIGKFQAARHRAAELLTQVETTRWAAYHALWQYEQDGYASEIWLAKHWAARAADRVFQIAHLLHGGVGVGTEHPLHLYTQSIAAFAVRSGTMDEMVDRTLQSLDIAV